MPDILNYEFFRNALFAAFLASITCGIIGCFIVVKRLVFISGGISHAAFGGIGLGHFLGLNPIYTAMVFSVGSAMTIGLISSEKVTREDSAIGILWVTGMAFGLLMISITPGYAPDLMSYLFGNIMAVTRSDLWFMFFFDLVLLVFFGFLYKELVAICFDEDYVRTKNIPVSLIYTVLYSLIAISVVLLISIVGNLLVIALLTIPAAISNFFTYNLKRMIVYAIIINFVATFSGLFISYYLDIMAGPLIIMLLAALFFIFFIIKRVKNF